jgi:hypothetical protein
VKKESEKGKTMLAIVGLFYETQGRKERKRK